MGEFSLGEILTVYTSLCSNIDNLDDIVAVAIDAEFHTTTGTPAPGKALNEQENARLQELYTASRALVEPLDLERSVSINDTFKVTFITPATAFPASH